MRRGMGMGCTIGNRGRSAGHDTVTVEMWYWRRGRRGMVGGRMEGMGLMETKVPAGLTGSVSKGHEGKEEGGGGKTREGGRGVETGRKAKR
jgi:hypothetical protein